MQQDRQCETVVIRGRFEPAVFLPWIARHAARLGLEQAVGHAEAGFISLAIAGPDELITALEMGCLLGPIDVWVDAVERQGLHCKAP